MLYGGERITSQTYNKTYKITFFLLILDLFYVTIRSKQLMVKKKKLKGCQLSHTKQEIHTVGSEGRAEFGRDSCFVFFFLSVEILKYATFQKSEPCAHLGGCRSYSLFTIILMFSPFSIEMVLA